MSMVFFVGIIGAALLVMIIIGLGAFVSGSGKQQMVQARFLSAKVMGGPVSIQDRGRVASGNTYARVAFKRLSFWCEELGTELNFTVKEDYPSDWKEGDEGVLTYAKKKFVSFSK